MLPPVFFVCSVCGSVVTVDADPGYRCPQGSAGEGGRIHRLVREIEPQLLHWPELGPENPFLRYRQLSSPYLRFRLAGGGDRDFVEGVTELEAKVAAATGDRFRSAPLLRSDPLEIASGREGPGSVLLQDRTSFAGGPGSWKALVLAFLTEWLGSGTRRLVTNPAAEDAKDALRLAGILGREVELRPKPGTELAVRPTVDSSASSPAPENRLPWTGWQDLNAWVLEGESFWAYEAVDRMRRMPHTVSRVFLTSEGRGSAGWVLGIREAYRLGGLSVLPRIHVVEQEGRTPVGRWYDATLREILVRVDSKLLDPNLEAMGRRFPRVRRAYADQLVRGLEGTERSGPVRRAVEEGLRAVLGERGPGSHYEEILVRGMIETGGFPVAVSEEDLVRGRMLSRCEPPSSGQGAPEEPTTSPPHGLASAGILRLFAHDELPVEEVLLAVDP